MKLGEMFSGPQLPARVVLLATGGLILSGLMQLATAWMQMQHRQPACPTVQTGNLPSSPTFENEYTWVGDDYPPYLPLDLGSPVALTLEDSRHYALGTPDADDEYKSLYAGGGLGFIRLGPNKRLFSLSYYHQIHCLNSLRRTILGQPHHGKASPGDQAHQKRDVEHSQHCLNYLRQAIMCAADLTLEPEIKENSGDVGEGLAVTHVCRDWSKVHAFVKKNWEDWQEWRLNKTVD